MSCPELVQFLHVERFSESPLQGLSATGKSMRFFYPIPVRQCRRACVYATYAARPLALHQRVA